MEFLHFGSKELQSHTANLSLWLPISWRFCAVRRYTSMILIYMQTSDTRNITFSQPLTWHIVKNIMKNVAFLDLLIYADSPLSILFFIFFIGVMFYTWLMYALMEIGHYEARVRFGTRVRVRVRDSAIFEKVGCGCGGTRRLKNY